MTKEMYNKEFYETSTRKKNAKIKKDLKEILKMKHFGIFIVGYNEPDKAYGNIYLDSIQISAFLHAFENVINQGCKNKIIREGN